MQGKDGGLLGLGILGLLGLGLGFLDSWVLDSGTGVRRGGASIEETTPYQGARDGGRSGLHE